LTFGKNFFIFLLSTFGFLNRDQFYCRFAMNETLVLNRDDAVRAIQDMLRMLGPQIKVEIQQ